MAKKHESAQDVMLAHSKAKIEYYQKYLERYVSIMSVAKNVDVVNIFDIFCGRGVYANGELGSPIQTVQTMQKICDNYHSNTKFNLYFNDVKQEYVNTVKSYIDEYFPNHHKFCSITYLNEPAEQLFDKLCSILPNSYGTKNFIFIDPYGYKDIHKNIIQQLMSKRNTEILLFLPISFMHRFTHYAFYGDFDPKAQCLRNFIEQFFPANHKIMSDEPMDIREYIDSITDALSFNDTYFTSSYIIERRKGHDYFALFSICSNLLGLEKAIETKWFLDELYGEGFHQKEVGQQLSLYKELFKEEENNKHLEELKALLCAFLRERNRTNSEIYRFILRKGYKKTHACQVLKSLQTEQMINVTLISSGEKARNGSFYINYNDAKDLNNPKIIIEIKKNENY